MMTLGPIGFMQPWVLGALAALPVIWWLLRFTPPRPRHVVFPPTRLLKGLEDSEQTAAHSPWWLTALRMLLAALLIVALARPVLNPEREALAGSGPLLIVVDNGWAAAGQWGERQRLIDALISRAERDGRSLMLAATARPHAARIDALGPEKAREAAASLTPAPYAPDRAALAGLLKRDLEKQNALSVVWLADGLDYGGASNFAGALAGLAGGEAALTVALPENTAGPLGLGAELGTDGELVAHVIRPGGGQYEGMVHAYSARGARLGESAFSLAAGESKTTARFDLPLEIRNQIARLQIKGESSAGAVHLLDARSHWRRVGVISGEGQELAQPLLSPLYYVERALTPYAEIVSHKGSNIAAGMNELLERNLSVLVLADIGQLVAGVEGDIGSWVERGGTLVRFAGPRLEKNADDLLPTELRRGGRTLGGSLSWSTPQPLAPFEETSPFHGLEVSGDVKVRRQVLADPVGARQGQVWARLKDGTPLVSAARRGDGWIILFHVTANADWSNLPMSGLFVQMLRRIVERSVITAGSARTAQANGATGEESQAGAGILTPRQVLDGFGQLAQPSAAVTPLKAETIDTTKPGPAHPPGYYGPGGAARAFNLISADTSLRALPSLSGQAQTMGYSARQARELKPWLFITAFVVFLADMIAVLLFSTGLRFLTGARAAASALPFALALGLFAVDARAQDGNQSDDAWALKAALKTRLAYVVTGDAEIDQISRAGLAGLSNVLTARTAVEPAKPMGVNVETDELAFFPLLYWPVRKDAQALPETTIAKIDAYMKQGGMIVFDTRDYQASLPSGGGSNRGPGAAALSRLLDKLDIPPLEPVPENHVLTKSFYLLQNFPGRWDGGALWVEATPSDEDDKTRRARRADGVSSLLITSNDFAAAWALDENNSPLYPVVPGGEVQREMAFRVGVNIVMYALTGNYKADQVHVPALLERLGQ